MSNQPPNTTTNAGIPVPSDEYSLTAGPAGPVLLQDAYLIEKLAHFVRATFRSLPGNRLELVAIDNRKLSGGSLNLPPRGARAAARSQPVPAGVPGAAPFGAVPAVGGVPRAPVAAQPNFAQALARRFRSATRRR